MIPLFGAPGVFDLRQTRLQLNAIHTALPKPLLNQCKCQFKISLQLRLCQDQLRVRSAPAHLIRTVLLIAQDLSAFSARFILSRSRNFIRALCNCDLLLPIEQPTIVAISLCS